MYIYLGKNFKGNSIHCPTLEKLETHKQKKKKKNRTSIHLSYHITEINSRWNTDLDAKTVKLLLESMG